MRLLDECKKEQVISRNYHFFIFIWYILY